MAKGQNCKGDSLENVREAARRYANEKSCSELLKKLTEAEKMAEAYGILVGKYKLGQDDEVVDNLKVKLENLTEAEKMAEAYGILVGKYKLDEKDKVVDNLKVKLEKGKLEELTKVEKIAEIYGVMVGRYERDKKDAVVGALKDKLEKLKYGNNIIIDFIYECWDCNPNGDPAADNMPRVDGYFVIPSKERIKKTTKMGWEYLDILNSQKNASGNSQLSGYENRLWVSGKAVPPDVRYSTLTQSNLEEDKLERVLSQISAKCLDARLFGATVAAGHSSHANFPGPLQVKDGRSVNRISVIYKMVNAAFSSNEKREQRSFGHQYKVPYALIHTVAVYNHVVASWNMKKGVVPPRKEDIENFIKGLWYGTKNLFSVSKFLHLPKLIIVRTVKKEEDYSDEIRKSMRLYNYLRRAFGDLEVGPENVHFNLESDNSGENELSSFNKNDSLFPFPKVMILLNTDEGGEKLIKGNGWSVVYVEKNENGNKTVKLSVTIGNNEKTNGNNEKTNGNNEKKVELSIVVDGNKNKNEEGKS